MSQNWSTKLKVQIKVNGGTQKGTYDLGKLVNISENTSRQQRTINTIAGARRGFVTVEGDMTGTFGLQEVDDNLGAIIDLYNANAYFDILLMENISNTEITSGEWKLSEVIAKNCKFESMRTRYDFGVMPVREFAFKYLAVTSVDSAGNEVTESSGQYANYTITVSFKSDAT